MNREIDAFLLVAGWMPGQDKMWWEVWTKGSYSLHIARNCAGASLNKYQVFQHGMLSIWTNEIETLRAYIIRGKGK